MLLLLLLMLLFPLITELLKPFFSTRRRVLGLVEECRVVERESLEGRLHVVELARLRGKEAAEDHRRRLVFEAIRCRRSGKTRGF